MENIVLQNVLELISYVQDYSCVQLYIQPPDQLAVATTSPDPDIHVSIFFIGHQQGWDAYASTLLYTFISQVRWSSNNHLYNLVLDWKVPNFTLGSTLSTEKYIPLLKSGLALSNNKAFFPVLALLYSPLKNATNAGVFARAGKRQGLASICLFMNWTESLKHLS